MSPTGWLRLGSAIGALLLVVGAFFYGRHVGYTECDNDHLKAAAAAQEKREKQIGQAQAGDAKAAEADVQRETIVREITREVPKVIDRPVYRNVCVDADGVRLIERAVEAANGGAPGSRSAGDPADLLEATRQRQR